jgi:NAD(P)H-dependent FMN reductase
MTYFLLVGSSRKGSQSAKVGAYIAEHIRRRHDLYTLNMADIPLLSWEGGGQNDALSAWTPHRVALTAAHGVIIVTPEWNGMAPPAVKNFFLWCDRKDVGHKPALIVAVSATRGGSYPVAELRMSSYKNTRICYIPEHVIVHDAKDVMNSDTPASAEDAAIRHRIAYALGVLDAYAEAMTELRKDRRLFDDTFKFGM